MHNDLTDVIWKVLNSYVVSYIMTEIVRQLWAWYCIFGGVDTQGLARALAQAIGHYSQSNATPANIQLQVCRYSLS